jgi:hypothetical protein
LHAKTVAKNQASLSYSATITIAARIETTKVRAVVFTVLAVCAYRVLANRSQCNVEHTFWLALSCCQVCQLPVTKFKEAWKPRVTLQIIST